MISEEWKQGIFSDEPAAGTQHRFTFVPFLPAKGRNNGNKCPSVHGQVDKKKMCLPIQRYLIQHQDGIKHQGIVQSGWTSKPSSEVIKGRHKAQIV